MCWVSCVMWELDHKEGWAPKNQCFLIVILEKTVESPLDREEIKPVSPIGNQPEYSLERLMLKLQYFGHLMNWLIGKDPDAGRIEGKRRGGYRGWDGWLASLTQWTWVWANSRRQWSTGKPGVLQSMGSQRVGHDLVTEPQIFIKLCLNQIDKWLHLKIH